MFAATHRLPADSESPLQARLETVMQSMRQFCMDAHFAVIHPNVSPDLRRLMRTSRLGQQMGGQLGLWRASSVRKYWATTEPTIAYLLVSLAELTLEERTHLQLPGTYPQADPLDIRQQVRQLMAVHSPMSDTATYTSSRRLFRSLVMESTAAGGETASHLYLAFASVHGWDTSASTWSSPPRFGARLAHVLYWLRCASYYTWRAE